MRFNRPLQAAKFFSPADTITLRELGRRAWIAGRDGTVVQSGGTGGSAICPWTGATIASGGICSALVNVLGIGALRLYHAQGQRINLCPIAISAFTTSEVTGSAAQDIAGGNGALRILESANTAAHYITGTAAAVVASGTTYTIEVYAKAAGRSVFVLSASGLNLGTFDLSAITATAGADDAFFTGKAATLTAMRDGWFRCRVTAACIQNLSGTFRCYLQQIATYAGDITKGMTFYYPQHVAATFPGIGLAEGITRTADNLTFTLPAALPQVCDIFHIGCQPYVDGDNADAASATFVEFNNSGAGHRMLRSSATAASVFDYDTAQRGPASITRTLPSRGTMFLQRSARTAAGVRVAYGAAALGAAVAGGPWVGALSGRIGHSSVAGRESYAANGIIIVPGGATDSEVAALARAVHLRALAAVA